MSNFGLIVIGAHTGVWLQKEFEKYKNEKILLIEPVPHNLDELKNNISKFKNIIIEPIAVAADTLDKKFYFVKKDSIHKLKKHWASGIGSFNKDHILDHKTKRFKITEDDISIINIKCLSISDLIAKHSIENIDTLQLDVEGSEYEILNSIDFNKININRIIFESKHFDGTFKEGKKLELIKNKLVENRYKLKQLDEENILAEKLPLI